MQVSIWFDAGHVFFVLILVAISHFFPFLFSFFPRFLFSYRECQTKNRVSQIYDLYTCKAYPVLGEVHLRAWIGHADYLYVNQSSVWSPLYNKGPSSSTIPQYTRTRLSVCVTVWDLEGLFHFPLPANGLELLLEYWRDIVFCNWKIIIPKSDEHKGKRAWLLNQNLHFEWKVILGLGGFFLLLLTYPGSELESCHTMGKKHS